MSYTTAGENEKLDYQYERNTWIGLSTTTPDDAGSNFTEPSGGAYVRKASVAGDWSAAASGSKTTTSALAFVEATASWGTVTHFGLFTASTGGTPFVTGTLTASKAIGSGDTAEFAIGALVATED